nr:FtsQ-type POTRA domain-containing protein [Schaalia hyovaginalis]
MVAGLAWVLLFSSLFALDPGHVTVEGAQSGLISEEEVRAAAAPYEGTPLPRVPTGGIASEIAKLPPVSAVEVNRRWPTGLDIALVLREPAMIEGAEGAYRLVDSGGVSFAPAEPVPEGLPYVVLPEGDKRQDAAEDVLAVWAACSDSLKARIGWVSADGLTVSFTIDTGATVKWGTVDDSALKARVVEVLIAQRGASVYDVSAPAHPVTV